MKIQGRLESIAKANVAGMLAVCLCAPFAARAVTPDSGAAISNFWTAANMFKEYWDWRGWAGWGTVGAANVAITVATGDSDGQFTKAAFSALCGSGAAGFVAAWKPASGPTVASHAKAIVKAGSIAAVSSACGWAAPAIFRAIDSEIPKAQTAINNAGSTKFAEIKGDAERWNNVLLTLESNFRSSARAFSAAKTYADAYKAANCTSPSQNAVCADLDSSRASQQAKGSMYLKNFNQAGSDLSAALKELSTDIAS